MSDRKDDQETSSDQLRMYQKLALGAGMVLPAMTLGLWYNYAVAFFEKILELPAKSTGIIVLLGQMAGAVFAPLLGVWSDQLQCRFGRRKTTHLVCNVAIILTFFFIWHDCITCEDTPSVYQIVYFASFASVSICGTSGCQMSLYALIPELAYDETINVELNSICTAFLCAGVLMTYASLWALLAYTEGGVDTANLTSNDQTTFSVMAAIVLGVSTVFALYFYIFGRDKSTQALPKLKWYKWFVDTKFYLVMLVSVAPQMMFILPKTYIPLYLVYSLKMDKTSIAKVPIVVYISMFMAALLTKWLTKLVGLRVLYIASQVVSCASIVWFWFMNSTGDSTSTFNFVRDSIYGAVVLLGVGNGIMWVITGALLAELIGKNTGSSAFVYGVQFVATYGSIGVAVMVIQELEPSQDSELPLFYRQALVFPVLAAACLGTVFMAGIYCHERLIKQKGPESQSNNNLNQLSGENGHTQTGMTPSEELNSLLQDNRNSEEDFSDASESVNERKNLKEGD